eukprot:g8946.t1
MVWNRRKQQWMEVDVTGETPVKGDGAASSPTSSTMLSSNAYASGVNQNAGNFLTEKPITRIHAPPGGVSSISFGDQHSAPAAGSATKPQPTLVLGTPTQPATPESAESAEDDPAPIPMMELPPAPSAEEEEEEEEEEVVEEAVVPPPAPPAAAAEAAVSSNAYATGSNQNSGNFMTGRPTTRVRAPPGGASSITFG